jgi:hypothetical protein
MAKWLASCKDYDSIPASGRINDVAHLISINRKGYIFDLTRDTREYRSIYAMIEMLKNGILISTKYQGAKKIRNRSLNAPIILVFTNELPNRNLLSRDRYRIFEISRDGDNYTDKTREFIETDEER